MTDFSFRWLMVYSAVSTSGSLSPSLGRTRSHHAAVVRLLAVLGLLWLQGAAGTASRAQSTFNGTVIKVETGDRVVVRIDTLNLTVKLHGIVCPITPKPLADHAREYAERRILNTKVRVVVKGTAAFQTVYGEVYPQVPAPPEIARLSHTRLDDLNKEMVASGLAIWAQVYAPGRTDIAALDTEARTARRGVWGTSNGDDIPLPESAAGTLKAKLIPGKAVATPKPRPATPSPAPSASPEVPQEPETVPSVAPPEIRMAHESTAGLPPVKPMRRSFPGPPDKLPPPPREAVDPAWPPSEGHPLPAIPVAVITALLACGCWFAAQRLWRHEQVLRTAIALEATSQSSVEEGTFVRVTGRAELYDDILPPPISTVGRVAGIYIHEITQRYEPYSEPAPSSGPRPRRRKGGASYHWVKVSDETQTSDFRLRNDAEGALAEAVIEVTRAKFHPLRIARYYNDVPVEAWFNRPYAGDTRTEVHYIPIRAEVTVWGRMYRSEDSWTPASVPHIGYDTLTHCEEIVEGDGSRLLSGTRPLIGVGLTLAGVALAALAAFALFRPESLPRF